MKNYALLTANTGLLLCINGKKILYDALHSDYVPGYSSVSKTIQEKIISGKDEFDKIDYMIVSHDHPDHISSPLINNYARLHPETIIFAPISIANCEHLNYLMLPTEKLAFGNDYFYFRKTIHDGIEFKDVNNYAGVININGTTISFFGDAAVNKNLASGEFLQGINIGIFNFPFISLSRGREIIKSINPDICLISHLPFIEDDINGYLSVTERIFEKKRETLPQTYIMKEECQKVSLDK